MWERQRINKCFKRLFENSPAGFLVLLSLPLIKTQTHTTEEDQFQLKLLFQKKVMMPQLRTHLGLEGTSPVFIHTPRGWLQRRAAQRETQHEAVREISSQHINACTQSERTEAPLGMDCLPEGVI